MRKSIKLLFMLFVLFMLTACGSNDASSENEGNNSGQGENLTVYSAYPEEHAIEAMNQFTEATGIEVEMIRMSAGEILAKVRAEKNNPQADIWYGSAADTFVAAKEEDLLQAYQSPEAEAIPEQYRDSEGYWTGVYIGAIGFATNKHFLEENGLDAPTSWDDLLDPAYKSDIVMGHPNSSGVAYTTLDSIIRAKGGEEEGFEYMNDLDEQIQQYTTSGGAPGRMVGLNEAGAGILLAYDIVKYIEEGYDDIILSFPEEGTGYEIGSVGIINDAPNAELAEQFVDWAVSPEAQEVGQTANNFHNLTHPDASEPEQAADLDSINLIESDPVEAGGRRQEIVDRWDNEVNN